MLTEYEDSQQYDELCTLVLVLQYVNRFVCLASIGNLALGGRICCRGQSKYKYPSGHGAWSVYVSRREFLWLLVGVNPSFVLEEQRAAGHLGQADYAVLPSAGAAGRSRREEEGGGREELVPVVISTITVHTNVPNTTNSEATVVDHTVPVCTHKDRVSGRCGKHFIMPTASEGSW